MALPSAGQLSIADLAAEFGGAQPNSLSAFYRGGALVPNVAQNNNVPASGQISINNFYDSVAQLVDWVTPSGSIGDVYSLSVGTTNPSVQATALSGGVTYSVVGGSIPAGGSLDESSGVITLATVPSSDTTSNFTLRAASVTKPSVFADRAFSVTMRSQRVQTFAFTGGNQTFTVPSGPSQVLFKCWGAGGRAGHGLGGGAGHAAGRRNVSPGQVYTLIIGGGNTLFAGAGNGSEGYRGGGYAGVFFGGTAQGNSVVIAGGGGGQGCGVNCGSSGGYRGGAGGGVNGTAGLGAGCASGGGGTQTAGGSLCQCNTLGTNQRGTALKGGNSGFGGGGGGGYFGGGSGCRQGSWQHTAGGGGSGFTGGLNSNQVNTTGGATTAANPNDADKAASVGNSNGNGQITVRF